MIINGMCEISTKYTFFTWHLRLCGVYWRSSRKLMSDKNCRPFMA